MIASNRPTDIAQSSSGQSRETLRSAVTTPTLEAAVSVAMAHRRKKPIELTYRSGQPIVTHLHSSHYAARMSPQPPPARFGSPRIGPNSRVPRSTFASMLRRNDV